MSGSTCPVCGRRVWFTAERNGVAWYYHRYKNPCRENVIEVISLEIVEPPREKPKLPKHVQSTLPLDVG